MQMIYIDTWQLSFRLDLYKENELVMPGDQATVRFTLPSSMPILEGQQFTLRENKITVGTGRITKLYDPLVFPLNFKQGKLANFPIKVDLKSIHSVQICYFLTQGKWNAAHTSFLQ